MHLFLTLLRITGILALAVILIIFVLLLFILFCPLRYRISLSREPDKPPKAEALVSWLLHILQFTVFYHDQLNWKFKLFGFTLFSNHDKGHAKTNQSGKSQNPVKEISKQIETKTEEKDHTDGTEKRSGKKLDELPDSAADWMDKLADFLDKQSNTPEILTKKAESLKNKWNRLYRQICDEQNRAAVSMLFGAAGSLIKHIRPRRLSVKGRLGFDDPALTGQIFGIIGMFMPIYGEHIQLEAVFDHAVAEGKLEAKGYIRIGYLLWLALHLIGKREVRRLIGKIKSRK